jgi:hypothetical protein
VSDHFEHHDVTTTPNELSDDSVPVSSNTRSRSRRTCWIVSAALLGGLVGIQLLVTQPLARQLDGVQRDLVRVERDMSELVGTRSGAWEASNLLSGLRDQSDQIDAARGALETIRDFREQVLEQATSVEEADSVVGQLAALQDRLLEGSARNQQAQAELNRLVQLRDVAMAESDRTDRAVIEITRLQQVARGLDHAHESITQLAALRDAILAGGTDTREARVTLDNLVVLQDTLNTHSADVDVARKNLGQLLTLEESLRDRSDEIADAVEALEVLTDLQQDIGEHVETLGSMRRDLIEVVLLESNVARVVRMLGPLTELARLRRLSGDEIRAAARSISNQRSAANHQQPTRRAIPEPVPGDQAEATRTAGTIRDIPSDQPPTADATGLFDKGHPLGVDRVVPLPAEATRPDFENSTP